ncbi:hypothetical protein LTR35_017846 [Friedmanniomyces endolithicus]|nr:hypothetical protein LTR35_017846 [Friedmanniomyces endolithicus]KAK0267355.1 hypothetical protein LTS00_017824 [Friedmanniomyces endolithicus]KAK0970915.1 hypothetical protein LTR54_017887 [Friedmanniomyces endolithicus]
MKRLSPARAKVSDEIRHAVHTSEVEGGFDEVIDVHVPNRYRGTESDRRDMLAQGKQQQLRRNFKLLTMTGFASMVVCAWDGLLAYLYFILTDGGTGLLFWGFIAVAIGMLLVYASVAEMASMSPTSAGQYHWVSEFAPPRYQRLLSYFTGWLCAIGWQTFLASVCFLVGTIIQGLIALNDDTYGYERWHGTLLTIAVICFAIVFNTLLAGKLPLTEGFAVIFHICGLFGVIIPLWCMAPRATAQDAFLTFTNNGGWPTTGLSCMIGLTAPITILIGYDCSAHMSEEIEGASINLPKSIMWAFALNGALAFLMLITVIFTLGDINSLIASTTGYPFIQLFFNATRSRAATNAMVFLVIFSLTNCAISETATASRQIWSFARDNGLPGSTWLSKASIGHTTSTTFSCD